MSSNKSGNYFLTWQTNWASVFQTRIAKTSCKKCQNNMFKELQFVSYRHNKVLVYTISLEMQNVIMENFELNFVLKLTSSKSDNEDNVFQVAKLLNGTMKNQQPQMSWPPTKDLIKGRQDKFIHTTFVAHIFYRTYIRQLVVNWHDEQNTKKHQDLRILSRRTVKRM